MQYSENELILRAQAGNTEAFEQLVLRYDRQVLAIATRYVSNADDAKDIYQEVFIRVFRGIKKFQFRSEFSTWLYRITTNVCLTHRTRRQQQTESPMRGAFTDEDGEPHTQAITADTAAPDQARITTEIAERIEAALDCLAPKQKMVFTLRHYQGYKLREIATMMDCTEGTVKRYLFLATHAMRELLREYHEKD